MAAFLYCVDDNNGDLWQIDTATPADSTLLGTLPATFLVW